jgi:hypothetical protein
VGSQDWNDDLIERCCSAYWKEATQSPGWEFLTPSCVVVEVISDTPIDPKTTKGGWLISREEI